MNMRKLLLFFIFLLLTVQFVYSIELLEVVDKVQKKINIKRFSFFEIKHDYSAWTGLKFKNPFIPQTEASISEYIKQQIISIQSSDSAGSTHVHKRLLEKIISTESEFTKLLEELEMMDQEKVLFLPLLKDIRTYALHQKTPFLIERMNEINTRINEIRYIKIDTDKFLEKSKPVLIDNTESSSERKIIEITEEMQNQAFTAFLDWYYGITEQYKNNDLEKALTFYYKSFNYYYSFLKDIGPEDRFRAKDLSSGIYYLTPITTGMPIYPWVCEDINICHYYLKKWDNMVNRDLITLSIFHRFKRKYKLKPAVPENRNAFPPPEAYEFTYVPGYFSYVAYREKEEYDTGITQLDSFINKYPGDWKTGYWNGYKAFFQLFQGKYPEAINSVNIALPILQTQTAEILERYKDEIDLIKECKAAAEKNADSILFYHLLKTEYAGNKYFQYWNLAEGYCSISMGNYSQAIPLLTQVISGKFRITEEESWIKAAHLYLGLAYYMIGDYANAEISLNNALSLAEDIMIDVVSHYIQGKIFEKQGMLQEAFEKYSFIFQKYGNQTGSDVKQIVDSAKAQAEAMLNFTVVNIKDQKPVMGNIGVNQIFNYEIKKGLDILGKYNWIISSDKISLETETKGLNATLKGISKSEKYQDTILTVTFKTEDQLEFKREIKMTCFDIGIKAADKFYPYNSEEAGQFKYQLYPEMPETKITFIVEKNGIPGYSETVNDTGIIKWNGLYNNSNVDVGDYRFVIEARKNHGFISTSGDFKVFDAKIIGKDVIYLNSSPVYEGISEPLLEGTYHWSGNENVEIISPDQNITEIKGIKMGNFDLILEFQPTGSRLKVKKIKRLQVVDPISLVLVEPQIDPILMNWKQKQKFIIKAVHAQGDPFEGYYTWSWSCPLGRFEADGFQNINPCTNGFTAESTGESTFKISFSYQGKKYDFERSIFVDKHIAIPSFTFFPADDTQLDIDDTQEFSVECRYNGDVIEKIGEWYGYKPDSKVSCKRIEI